MIRQILLLRLYCSLVFTLILGGLFLPGNSDKPVMVFMPADVRPGAIFTLLSGTDPRLIDQLSDQRYVMLSNSPDRVEKLYDKGASPMINAIAIYGCGDNKNMFAFGKTLT